MPGTEHALRRTSTAAFSAAAVGRCDLTCARYVEYILEKEGDIAAVVAEPIRSTPYIPKPEYWQAIRRACDRHGALLIFDEIPPCAGPHRADVYLREFRSRPGHGGHRQGIGRGCFAAGCRHRPRGSGCRADRALGHYTMKKIRWLCAAALATIDYIEKTRSGRPRAGSFEPLHLERLERDEGAHPLIGDVAG